MHCVNLRHFTTTFGCLSLVSLLTASASAQTTLDFDSLTGMANSPGSSIPVASQLSNQFLASNGVLFTSGTGSSFAAVVVLGAGHATSGVNGIGGATAAGDLTYSGNGFIAAGFFNPADGVSPFVTDSVSVRGDLIPAGGSIALRAFDAFNNLLGSDVQTDTGGNTLSVNFPGIHRVEIDGSGNVAFDDFTYGDIAPAGVGANAPEPGTLFLILPAVIGGLLIRRR
jgi:hypothetical protein